MADRLQAPIGHTLRAKDVIQYDNPYDVGMTGLLGYGACYKALHDADLVLLLGTDFPYDDFLPTHNNIQIDIDPIRLGRRAPVIQGIAADVGLAISAVPAIRRTKPITTRLTTPHSPRRPASSLAG